MQKYKRDKCMLACNLDVLHFYRAKARERDPGGGELAWRMRGKKAWHRAKARERDPEEASLHGG